MTDLAGCYRNTAASLASWEKAFRGLSGSFDDIYTAFTSTDPMAVVSAGMNGVIGLVSLVTNQIMENPERRKEGLERQDCGIGASYEDGKT